MSKIELQHWGIPLFNSPVLILSGLQEGEVDGMKHWLTRELNSSGFGNDKCQGDRKKETHCLPYWHHSIVNNTSAWQQGYHSFRLFLAYINTAVLEFIELHLTGIEITYILLQSFITINNILYMLNLMTIDIPCTRNTWSIKSTGALQQCGVIALHFTKRIPKSEQPSTVLTNCNCHKYP